MAEQLSFGRPPLLEDTPENREMMRKVLAIFRQYFDSSPFVDREIWEWAREQHHKLMGKKERG